MAGFITDYINLIVGNLRDRYKSGFPILKELVQNADDAGAKSLAFGYHEGHGSNADHMLLKGPALWVLNDGGFKSSDKDAIRSFGVNAKAGDAGVIGKFGLGMKSVFHLCEGFFYLASREGEEHNDFLNPWHSSDADVMHKAWETVTKRDLECLKEVAEAQTEAASGNSWFILWVPLRMHAHIPKESAAILERYPGEDSEAADLDFFSDPMTERRIGALLPLLRNLQKVRFAGMKGRATYTVELESRSDGKRLDHMTENLQIHGLIKDNKDATKPMYFLARQRVQNDKKPFTELRSASSWPKSNVISRNPDTNKNQRGFMPDKASAEAAVMFSHADGRKGSFELQWAVFLPVDEQQFSYKYNIDNSSREYKVVLHGQFFVDSGRRGILSMDSLPAPYSVSNEKDTGELVLKQWNQALAQELALPELLPSLSEYVASAKLNDEEISTLCYALRDCSNGHGKPFFETFREYICKHYVWVREFTNNGSKWGLISNEKPVLYLPTPPKSDPGRPWRTLVCLDGLRARYIFADKDAPNIIGANENWSEELLLRALEKVPVDLLESQTLLDYFASFLEMEAGRYVTVETVQERLVEILNDCLKSTPLHKVRQHGENFRRVISFLKDHYFFGFGAAERTTRFSNNLLYKELLETNSTALLLPKDLCPTGREPKPQRDDLASWLKVLGNSKDASEKERLGLADNFLSAVTGDDRRFLLRTLEELKLIRATNGLSGEEQAVSIKELEKAYQQGFVFKRSNAIEWKGKVQKLANALPESKIFIVHSRVTTDFENLLETSLPDSLNDTAILKTVGSFDPPPMLGTIAQRAELLSLVSEGALKQQDVSVIRGVRYLLHNSADHYRDINTTLLKEGINENSPWAKLLNMIDASPWKIIDRILSGSITDNCSRIIKIDIAKEETVIPNLRNCNDFDKIKANKFNNVEISEILNKVHNHYQGTDSTVWKKLPLHQDINGNYGNVLGKAFLSSDSSGSVELPSNLGVNIRLIKPCRTHAEAQNAYLKLWDEETAASIILESDNTAQYWRMLMDLLKAKPGLIKRDEWTTKEWLLLQNDDAISLEKLIKLETLEREIKSLSEKCNYIYAQARDLLTDIQAHPAYETLLGEVSVKEKALPKLAKLMSAAGCSIGQVAGVTFQNLENHHFDALAEIDEAWNILVKAIQLTSRDDVRTSLVPTINNPLTSETCLSIIRQISGLEERAQQLILEIYLKEWVNQTDLDEARKKLPSMRLLNRAQEWKPTSKLTVGVNELADEFVLHDSLASILKERITIDNTISEDERQQVSRSSSSLKADLEALFNPLFDTSSRPAAGAVIGLFGESLAPLATKWLEPLAYEDYLDKLAWKTPGHEEHGYDRRGQWMSGKSLQEALGTLSITLNLVTGESVTVRSIINTPFEATMTRAEDVNNLFIKADSWYQYNCTVHMRDLGQGFASKEPEKQKQILMQTAETILRDLYGQENCNLSELFDFTDQANQVGLSIARRLILDSLPYLLTQIPKDSKDLKIREALDKHDAARKSYASAEVAANEGHMLTAKRQEKNALEELAKLVEEDLNAQQTLLNGIKERVVQNQYDVSSIPFEIFQNADDAVAELQALQRADGRNEFQETSIGRFVLEADDNAIRFAHWGRPINYTGIKNTNNGYSNDLDRMLMLGGSDKQSSGGDVTGKFGLGFKSTLLASDTPRVWSRDLRFEVVAGCLPKKWEVTNGVEQFKVNAEKDLRQLNASGLSSTIVDLPLKAELKGKEIVEKFTGFAGLLAVFAKQIRHIKAIDKVYKWEADYIIPLGSSEIQAGSVLLPEQQELTKENIAVIRTEYGSVAFRIGAKGIEGFNKRTGVEIPNIWVTAPTRGTTDYGFILNAGFQIDTGRTKLANSGPAKKSNEKLLDKLADAVAQVLIELYQRAETDWGNIAEQLGVSSVSVADFWFSLWDTLLGKKSQYSDDGERELIERFACRVIRIVTRTINHIPNGLPGDLARLIPLDAISIALNSSFSTEILSILSRWNKFTNKYPLEGWCSNKVVSWLRYAEILGDSEETFESLAIEQIFNTVLNNFEVEPEDVESLGKILEALPKGEVYEYWMLNWKRYYAVNLKLRSLEGGWSLAENLIFDSGSNNGEQYLIKFAPKSRSVHPGYEIESSSFKRIVKYLPESVYDSNITAIWCLAANELASQEAVIGWLTDYCYYHRREIMFYLEHHKAAEDNWLFDLTEASPSLQGLDQDCREWLLESLSAINNRIHEEPYYADNPSYEANSSYAGLDIESIYDWWKVQGKEKYLKKFERKLYPAEFDRQALTEELPFNRRAWMTLFSLGLFRRYGRVKDEQHRGFIEFLDAKQWWRIICEVKPDTTEGKEAWMNILLEYGEAQEAEPHFEQWMDSFPRLYRMARWLDTYVELFQSLDMRSVEEAHYLLAPAADPALQGAGIEAPTLSGILRQGQYLVIRELLRSGVINSDTARHFAYAPRDKVQELLQEISSSYYDDLSTSKNIYECLVEELGEEKACFDGDYDIPLQIIAMNENARLDLRGWMSSY